MGCALHVSARVGDGRAGCVATGVVGWSADAGGWVGSSTSVGAASERDESTESATPSVAAAPTAAPMAWEYSSSSSSSSSSCGSAVVLVDRSIVVGGASVAVVSGVSVGRSRSVATVASDGFTSSAGSSVGWAGSGGEVSAVPGTAPTSSRNQSPLLPGSGCWRLRFTEPLLPILLGHDTICVYEDTCSSARPRASPPPTGPSR